MKIAGSLGITRVGRLKILHPALVSQTTEPQTTVWYQAREEIRAASVPSESLDVSEYFPPLGFRQLHNVSVTGNRRFSAVISGSKLLLPTAAGHGPWRLRVGEPTVGGILRQDENLVLVDHRKKFGLVSDAIFVGSKASHNWYHWIVDNLPSIYLARKLPEEFASFPVLIDEEALSRPSWLEPLSLVIGNRETISLPRDRYLTVENLVWVDSPSFSAPLQASPSSRPPFRFHPRAMRDYRDFLIASLGLESDFQTSKHRIFLARREGSKRPFNQEELIDEAEEFGYEPVFLEDLSFADSVKTLRGAESVVGPHGAGWANAMFCRPGTNGIIWTWQEALEFNWFSNVAHLSEMRLTTLVHPISQDGRYQLEPQLFREALQSLHT